MDQWILITKNIIIGYRKIHKLEEKINGEMWNEMPKRRTIENFDLFFLLKRAIISFGSI